MIEVYHPQFQASAVEKAAEVRNQEDYNCILYRPNCPDLEILRELKAKCHHLILVVDERYDIVSVQWLHHVRISGFIHRNQPFTQLMSSLDYVMQGQGYIDPIMVPFFLEQIRQCNEKVKLNDREPDTNPQIYELLSEREQDILKYIGEGLSNSEIAAELFIAPKSVSDYISTILKKLNVNNRVSAVKIAIKYGLLDLESWLADDVFMAF